MQEYPKTRAEAKSTGARYYFTGEPCKHGHVALRKTKGICVECMRREGEIYKDKRNAYFKEYGKSAAGQKAKKAWYERNRDSVIAAAMARPKEDKERYRKTWAENNPEALKALLNARRRRYRIQSPSWLTKEHKKQMRAIQLKAIALKKATGVQYVVDHIYPLQGIEVSGLHAPWNMQILTHEENGSKSNKLPPDWLAVAFPEEIPGGESCIQCMRDFTHPNP